MNKVPPLTLPSHGGNLAEATARWGNPADGWLDLSTGLNPWAYPIPMLDTDIWRRLPDQAADLALRLAAALRYGVNDPARLLAAGGSSALITALPRLFAPSKKVVVFGPTYAEHQAAWALGGHCVTKLSNTGRLPECDVAIIVNPNNPDGRILPIAQLTQWAHEMSARGGLLVVDEAFGDLTPDCSIAPLNLPATLILRSFGKFYGLAGMRLGFAIAPAETLDPLKALLGPWPVSGPAMEIARIALGDEAWTVQTHRMLRVQAQSMTDLFTDVGLQRVGGTALFTLIRHPNAPDIWNSLGRSGILVRAFAHNPQVLRIGLPKSDTDRGRLRDALMTQNVLGFGNENGLDRRTI